MLISGYGNIPQRHILNLLSLTPISELVILRRTNTCIEDDYGVKTLVYRDLETALLQHSFDMALVCSPASDHFSQIETLMKSGVPCFVEKPVTTDWKLAEKLLEIHRNHPTPILLGYDLRYTSGFKTVSELINAGVIGEIWRISAEVGQYLPDWRPNKNYQLTVSSQRKLGGGALRELSHELDYLNGLFKFQLQDLKVNSRNHAFLEMDCENEVQVIANAKVAQQAYEPSIYIALDMLSRKTYRKLKVSGSDMDLIWDLVEQKVKLCSDKMESDIDVTENANQPYINLLKEFVEKVQHHDCDNSAILQGIGVMELIKLIESKAK